MPKYLSARRLGVSTAEHRAMVAVLAVLAAVPRHPTDAPEADFLPDGFVGSPGTLFDMGLTAGLTSCGTVACLGGHVGLAMAGVDLTQEFPVTTHEQRVAAHEYVVSCGPSDFPADHPRRELYYPLDAAVYDATAVQASFALRNFLTTGRADWPRALAEAPPPPGPAYGDPDHPYDPE